MKRILPAFYAIAFIVLSGNLSAQPSVRSNYSKYMTLENGRSLRLEAGNFSRLELMPDMYNQTPLWGYRDTKIDGEYPLGGGFLNVGTDIYLFVNGGTGSDEEKKTVIKHISMEGEALQQLVIPVSWKSTTLKILSEKKLAFASMDSIYILDHNLEVIKQVKGTDLRIKDFDTYGGHIYTIEDDSDHSSYQIVEYNENLEVLDRDTIRVDPGSNSYTCNHIAFNTQGECFLREFWYGGSESYPRGLIRKLDTDMVQEWESPEDSLWSNTPVFAPLDNGKILVSSDLYFYGGLYIVSGSEPYEKISWDRFLPVTETDSSYSLTEGYRAYHYSKRGEYIPWYQKVFIEYPENQGPDPTFCFPDAEPVVIQLGEGYPGGNIDINWSTGSDSNPLTLYSTGKYWANFDYEDGNKAYTDTVKVSSAIRPQLELDYQGALDICEGSSLSVTVNITNDNGEEYDYELDSMGSFDQTLTLSEEGTYTVTVTDSHGCSTETAIELSVKKPYAEELCMVSVDPVTEKNLVVWKKTPEQGTAEYKITRGFGHTEIGTVDWDAANYLVDESSEPHIQAYRYFLTSTDTCGNSLMNEISHKTLHLTTNEGTTGEINLIWEHYQGVNAYQYNFYRSTDGENYEKIGAMEYDPDISQWSDYDHPMGVLYYKIGLVGDFSCDLVGTAKSAVDASAEIFSNVKQMNTSDVENPVPESAFTLYPNPASDRMVLHTRVPNGASLQMEMINLLGNVVYEYQIDQDEVELVLPANLSGGMYVIRISGFENGRSAVRKVLIKR